MSGNLLMTGCCCDASPCDDCSDPSASTVVVSGGYNATLTYNAKYTLDCECYWTWGHVVDSVTVITLTVAWTGSGWCAQAYSTTLGRWTSDDCICGSRLGAITGLTCDSESGKITGSFNLPKVGGGAALSVSMT